MNTQELDIVTLSESSRATDGKRQAVSTVTNGVTHFVKDYSSAANEQVHLECNVAENTGTPQTNTETNSQRCSTHLKHLKDDITDLNVKSKKERDFFPQETDLVTTMDSRLTKKPLKSEASKSTNWGFPSASDAEDLSDKADYSQEHEPGCLKLPAKKVSHDFPKVHEDADTNRLNEIFNRRNASSRYTSKKERSNITNLPHELQGELSESSSSGLNEVFEHDKKLRKQKSKKSFARTRTERSKQRVNLPNHIPDISSAEDLSSAEDAPYFSTRSRDSFDNSRSVMQTRTKPARRTLQRDSSSEAPSFQLEDPWKRPFVQTKSSTTTMHIIPETPNTVVRNNIPETFDQASKGSMTNRTSAQRCERRPENQRSNSAVELERIEDNRLTNERTPARGRLANENGISDRSRNDIDLLSRPTWCDAKFALSRVRQGEARGNPYALKLRSSLQSIFFWLGCFTQKNAKYVLFLGFLFLSSCAAGLRHAHMETDINKLWVETGSQLNQELEYTKAALTSENDPDSSGAASGYTIQMLIQTGNNALTPESLKLHLTAAIAATKVTVTMYNQTWGFSDVCYKETIPVKDEFDSVIASILEKLFPCFIIGPLDCFWEGAKLLGPTPPIYLSKTLADITWTNVNPLKLIDGYIETLLPSSHLRDTLGYYKNLMLQAGITTGYQERWCLDPNDPECPETAPNHKSKELPDIKALLRDGCSGFASTLMKWPIDLIVGGIEKDDARNITRAQGLQTLFNLMNANNMYEFHKGIKTGHDWSIDRAEEILSNWQRSFVEKIYSIAEDKNMTKNTTDALHAFSETTAADILAEFSTVSYIRVMGGYLLMMGYACLSLMRWNASRSQGAVGVIGVLLIALSVAAGLGICSVFGISFNAASTQVLPFLLLGLGVDDMFLMAHHFGEISVLSYIPFEERTGECLKRVGVSVFLTSIAILSGFLFSLIIPMPALRAFGLQASIVTLFNLIAVLVVFPAILSVDLQRRKYNKLDILCCFDSSTMNDVVDITQQNTIQNSTCDHVVYHQHHTNIPPVHNPATLPGNPGPMYDEPEATTITMHHTIQAYSNDSYMTVLGPSTGTTVSSASTPRNRTGTTTPVPPYEPHPNTPPPEYTARIPTRDYDRSRPTNRPRVAFVNQAISEPSTGRSTPATSGFNGRISRRGNGSNPPTNLTTPMESVRSSTHSLVPHRRRGRRSGCFGKRSGSIYARLATIPSLTISQLGERYYAPFLLKKSVRIGVIVLFIGLLGMSIYGATLIEDGLEFGDILPRGTREHAALIAQTTYFSFYNMYIVTKSFDYASNQKNLDKLHTSMKSISYVMRNTDGTLTKHWLDYMRDWLQDLQTEFDTAWANGEVNSSTWTPQASDKTVLAFKLLLQTGKTDQPIEKGNIGCRSYVEEEPCKRVDRVRLVSDDESRTIPEAPFYNYLSAWVGNDPLSYSASQAQIRPKPTSWSFVRDLNMIIPRSPAIIYAQMPFYLNNMRENQDFVNVIEWVRGGIESVEAGTSVSAYPSGHPFTFWQQYIDLRFWLFISLGCVILAVFLVLSIVLFNPWAAGIMALFLTMIATELLGFMGATKVKLSAVPAVILVASIGLGVEFTVHITFAYITSCGSREERVKRSIGHMLGPVIDGSISTLLGVVMLAGAEFDFIVTYFFEVLAILILLGFLNGVVLLPVLLSFIGPPPEVIPVGGGSRLKTPTPPPSPPPELEYRCPMHHHHQTCTRANRNGDGSGFYCYPRRPPAWYQHHPHCTGSHFSSRDDMHSCHRPIHRRNAVRRRGHDETVWRQSANNCASHNHHEGYTLHTPNYNRNFRYPNEMQRNEPHVAWQQHPFAGAPNPRREDTSQVFVCPHAEYVVYSSGATPPNEPLQDNHCETESNNLKPSESSQGERLPGKGSNHRNNQVPTLTATSSLTVKVHSGRQPVVAFVEPPTTSTSRAFPNQTNAEVSCHQRTEPETRSHSYQSSRRRFDISALTQQEPSDFSMHPNSPSS